MKTAKRTKRREALARRVVQGMKVLSVKLMDLEEDIRALWTEFDNLGDGETIMGCATKREFCIKILDRTPRAVRYMLTGGNPLTKRTGETVSPSESTGDSRQITDVVWSKVSAFSSESFMGCIPELLEHLRNDPVRDPEEVKTLCAITNALEDAIERLSASLDQIKPYVKLKQKAA